MNKNKNRTLMLCRSHEYKFTALFKNKHFVLITEKCCHHPRFGHKSEHLVFQDKFWLKRPKKAPPQQKQHQK